MTPDSVDSSAETKTGAAFGDGAFPVHCDDHGIFVVQLQGSKKWTLWPAPTQMAFRSHLGACSTGPLGPPLSTVVMQAGDVLYIPNGVPHKVQVAITPPAQGEGAAKRGKKRRGNKQKQKKTEKPVSLSAHLSLGLHSESFLGPGGAQGMVQNRVESQGTDEGDCLPWAICLAVQLDAISEQQEHSQFRRTPSNFLTDKNEGARTCTNPSAIAGDEAAFMTYRRLVERMVTQAESIVHTAGPEQTQVQWASVFSGFTWRDVLYQGLELHAGALAHCAGVSQIDCTQGKWSVPSSVELASQATFEAAVTKLVANADRQLQEHLTLQRDQFTHFPVEQPRCT
jgi:hypothetical protein